MRNKVKRFVWPVVDSHYGLHPDVAVYAGDADNFTKKELGAKKRQYVEQKVEELFGKLSPFLWGYTDSGVRAQFFSLILY